MSTEFEKMRNGEMANTSDVDIQKRIIRAKKIILKLNNIYFESEEHRGILEELIPNFPKTSTICPPFYCDHGDGIIVGENVFINSNCTFLDGASISIGDYTLIGPNVQIYTPQHPMNSLQRRDTVEYSHAVSIGDDCWIGGGVIICPGVKIGNKCVIGAGSVVTKDIEDNSLAVGNPAKVIKRIE